jgi:putative IMPACT (imprinted ancient) family translation regulator
LVAVIRYYGGTKLGVSGLIDAYKNAAKLAIEASGVEECEVEVQYALTVSHEETPSLRNALNRLSFRKLNTRVELDFTIEISIKEESEIQFLSMLKDLRLTSLEETKI